MAAEVRSGAAALHSAGDVNRPAAVGRDGLDCGQTDSQPPVRPELTPCLRSAIWCLEDVMPAARGDRDEAIGVMYDVKWEEVVKMK